MDHATSYQELLAQLREITLVSTSQELLAWDELTYLPEGGTDFRARQLAEFAGRHHALATDKRIPQWLAALKDSPLAKGSEPAAIIVRELRRQYERQARQPRTLVEELAHVCTHAQAEWNQARRYNDFGRFAPWLKRIILLKREQAKCLAGNGEPFAPLLAEFEPGLEAEEVGNLITSLGAALQKLLPEILNWQVRGRNLARPSLRGEFPVEKQREFGAEMAANLGFDFRRGRIDESVHPFTTLLGPHDCRIAIRYESTDLRYLLFVLLHELGHALYDLDMPTEFFGTPAAEAPSLSVHEALARLWENFVGRSLGFWKFLGVRVSAKFNSHLSAVEPVEYWRAVNHVAPTLIRSRADEVTYNLHILLRYELERALLDGSLSVEGLPSAWNARHQELLGITPHDDRDGCLQDGHWASGMFGYFPTYTIGNLLAAQWRERASADLGDMEDAWSRGEFGPLREWLAAQICRHGRRYSTAELAQRISGRPLEITPLLDYLRKKHEAIWLG